MIAGPNGSGKSTLLDYLSKLASTKHFSLGFVQNPDALQKEIVETKRLYLGHLSVHTTDDEFSVSLNDTPSMPKSRLRYLT